MSELRRNSGVFASALVALVVVGCGGGGEETGEANEPAATEAPKPAGPVADAATINVNVAFTGTAPAPKAIDMTEEKVCADKVAGNAKTEEVVVNDGKLQNVFVYVKDGLAAGAASAPTDKVTVDQDGCIYKPHVVGVQVGQPLVFKNSDGILHNVKATPATNRGFNISQPTTMESERTFPSKEVMIPVECNVHGWMTAYVGVLDHPYFAVSGNDGNAKIGNLPPGTYTIEAWHEKYGTQTQSVTVAANETKDITFTFNPATATRVPLGKPIHVAHGHAEPSHGHTGGR